jgi:hypothetical protein
MKLSAVTATRDRFFVVALGDRDNMGFNERTLPALVSLVDAHFPDYRDVTHLGVMVYFKASTDSLRRVRSLTEAAEQLRKRPEFATLGIGMADGPMIAGSSDTPPLGTSANDASCLSGTAPDAYLTPLNALLREYRLI